MRVEPHINCKYVITIRNGNRYVCVYSVYTLWIYIVEIRATENEEEKKEETMGSFGFDNGDKALCETHIHPPI